jgi:hypothetical protein
VSLAAAARSAHAVSRQDGARSSPLQKRNPFSVESLLSDATPRRKSQADFPSLPSQRPLVGKGHFLLYPITHQPLGFLVPQTALKGAACQENHHHHHHHHRGAHGPGQRGEGSPASPGGLPGFNPVRRPPSRPERQDREALSNRGGEATKQEEVEEACDTCNGRAPVSPPPPTPPPTHNDNSLAQTTTPAALNAQVGRPGVRGRGGGEGGLTVRGDSDSEGDGEGGHEAERLAGVMGAKEEPRASPSSPPPSGCREANTDCPPTLTDGEDVDMD